MKAVSQREYLGWSCRAKKEQGTCKSRQVANSYVDTLVGRAIQQVLELHKQELAKEESPSPKKAMSLTARIDRLIEMKTRVKNLYILGRIDINEYDTRTAQVDQEITALSESSDRSVSPYSIVTMIDDLADSWSDIPQEHKHELLQGLGASITVNTGERPLWIELSTMLSAESIKVQMLWTNK